MSKTGWKHRLLAGFLCAALTFQNLSLSAFAAGSAGVSTGDTVDTQTEETEEAQEASEEQTETTEQTQQESQTVEETGAAKQEDETAGKAQEESEADGSNTSPKTSVQAGGEEENAAVMEMASGQEEDNTTIQMAADAGAFIGKIDISSIEISGVNRNHAKWIELKPSEAGTYHIYTTNDGTNTYGDPLVGVYSVKNDKVEKDKAATAADDNIVIWDNNAGHNYKNFYASLDVTADEVTAGTSWFIFAGSQSSQTDEQTKYRLYVEKAGPVHGGDAQAVEADKTVTVSGVSEYKYRWLSFTALEDGIYRFELTGEAKEEGVLEIYPERSEDAQEFSTDHVTMRKGQTMYARAYAAADTKNYAEYEDPLNQRRRAYDTVSFDVKAVTVAKADSFVLDISKVRSDSAVISYNQNDFNFGYHSVISYKEHDAESYSNRAENTGRLSLNALKPGCIYDVQLEIYTNARLKDSTAADDEGAALVLTKSFATKAAKPVNYTLNEAVDDYTIRAVIEQITGGFEITNLKVEKSGSDNDGSASVNVGISYKESTAEDSAYEAVGSGSVSCMLGSDINVTDCKTDGLYLGMDYKLKFEITDGNGTKTVEKLIQAGNWYDTLEPVEKRGYGSFVLDFSQVSVKPSAANVKYVNESGAEGTLNRRSRTSDQRIYSYNISSLTNTEPYDLILEVTDEEGNTGRKKLTTKLAAWNTADIGVQIGEISYNEEEAGINVPVTLNVPAEVMPDIAVQAGFTAGGSSKNSKSVPLKNGKAELVIPGLDAGAEGTLTIFVKEDRYLGTYADGLTESAYVTLFSHTPTEEKDGVEQDKVYTVGASALYTADLSVEPQIDSAKYSVTVSKLRLGGEIYTGIEYAPETKADADNGIDAVSAAKNLEDGFAYTEFGPMIYFDEGKDPVSQSGSLTYLNPDYEYAYRLKLYNADGVLLFTSEVKTFRTLPISSLIAEQTVTPGEGKERYEKVALGIRFNMTVNSDTAGSVTVKYSRREAGKTPQWADITDEISGWEQDPLNPSVITCELDISGFIPGASYDWLITEYGGTAIDEATAVKGTKVFTVPAPELTVEEKTGRYGVDLTLSSADMGDYLAITSGKQLILYYTDDTGLNPSQISDETPAADISAMNPTYFYAGDFTENAYTQQQEAARTLYGLKAGTGYNYAVYLVDGSTYICLKSGRFTTGAALAESDFKITKTEETAGYAQYQLVYSYAAVPEDVDIERAVRDGAANSFAYGTQADGTTEKKGTPYAKGVIVKAKLSDGADTPNYTYISENLDVSGGDTGIVVDPVRHTISLTINYNNLKRWLGLSTATDFKLLSDISIEPYITVQGGGKVNDSGYYEKSDLIMKAGTHSVAFRSLNDAVLTEQCVQAINTAYDGVDLTIEGQISPVYRTDEKLYAMAVGYAMENGLPVSGWVTNAASGNGLAVVDNKTGKFTINLRGLEYATKFTVNVCIVTENANYVDGFKIDAAKYINCSKIFELGTVETKEDFVATVPVNVTDNAAELLVWSRMGKESGYRIAVARKESNPALFETDTPDDFDQAAGNYGANIQRVWNSYGVDVTNDALLEGTELTGLTPDTDYIYAIVKIKDGKYVRIAGGSFTTKKYAEAEQPYEYGYAFYKGKVTDTEANFSATIAPKYVNSGRNYTIRMTYYAKGSESDKLVKDTIYRRPAQPIKLEKLQPNTEYIVEKVEILTSSGALLDTYTDEELNFTTAEKPQEGTLREGSALIAFEEGTLLTDGFKVRTEFVYENDKLLAPFQISVYEGTTPVHTKRDISFNAAGELKEVTKDDGSKYWEYKKKGIAYTDLKPGTAYTVKAEILTEAGTVVLAETTITTLEDTEYDLGTDTFVKDASLRKHIISVLEAKGVVLTDNKVKRSEIEEANITSFFVGSTDISKDTPPVKTLDGIELLGQLTELTITHQDLVSADAAAKLPALTRLNISYNELTVIPDLRECTKLTDLDISVNKIEPVTFDQVTWKETENGVEKTTCRNIGIAHIAQVKCDGQRAQSYSLTVEAFDTVTGIEPKVEASVEGYRTDRKYKAVIKMSDASGDRVVESVYVPALNNVWADSLFDTLYDKQAALTPGTYTMKVSVVSEEAYNFGEVIAEPEGTFMVNGPVAFEDAVLEAAVRKICTDEEIAVADITELTLVKGAADTAITSLKGLEALVRLETLVVRGHEIKDATPLATIETLQKIDLSHNAVETVPDFDLPNLIYLDLSYNALTSIPNLERCDSMVEWQGITLVLDYRWNSVADPEKVFTRTNYRIPEYFRYLNGWLAKQAACQRGEEDNDSLLLEITDSTFAAAGEKLNSRIVVNGLEYSANVDGTNETDNTFTMTISEGGRQIGTADGVYVHMANEYPYHYFKFTELPLSDGEHTLTFEISSPGVNNYGTVGTVEKTVVVRRNVIEDEAFRRFLTTEAPVTKDANVAGETRYIIQIDDAEGRIGPGELALDEIKEFAYEGAIGREPVRSLKGIKYLTALEKLNLQGNELENTAENEWFTELGTIAGIAPDEDVIKGRLTKVNLSYNNLTTAPENLLADVTYNLIGDQADIADTQRDYQLSAEDIYYRITESNTMPVYLEPEGLKIAVDKAGNVKRHRKYRFELSENGKVIAAVSDVDGGIAYKTVGEATKLGIYMEDTKLSDGEHTLTLTATDDLGQKTEFGEFSVVIADPVTWAVLQTRTNGLAAPELTTDNEIEVMLSAPYLRDNEQFMSLTVMLDNEAGTVVGTYRYPNGGADLPTKTTDKETLYNSKLSQNMPDAMRRVKKVQFGGRVDVIEPLTDGTLYKVVVETTAGRTLTAEGVRFGLDGKREITGVTLSTDYDSTGDDIYIRVDGVGIDFDSFVPVLYSRERVELTDTETAKKVEVHQISGNNAGFVVYKLKKLHKPIWEGDIQNDSLFTIHDGRTEDIAYELRFNEGYEIQPELSAEAEGYIADYKRDRQSISERNFAVYSAVFNYATGELEVDFGEKASSDPVRLTAFTPQADGAAQIGGLPDTAVVKNGIAYFDLTGFDIAAGTYNLTFQNGYDNNVRTANWQITFVKHYKGPAKADQTTTWGEISTYLVNEEGAEEETQFFAEGTKKIGYHVTLHSDIYNHLAPYKYRLVLTGEGIGGSQNVDKADYSLTKVISLSAPDAEGNMTAKGVMEMEVPLTVGGNTDTIPTLATQDNGYTLKLQYQGRDRAIWDDVCELHTDRNGNEHQQGAVVESRIYVYAPDRQLASLILLDDEAKTLTITTNNANELATNGYGVLLTYLDGTTEEKSVSDVTVTGNKVVLGLADILSDKACWIDVIYGEEKSRFYYQYMPEMLYGTVAGIGESRINGHDAYYDIHERLRFLIDDYGYYYGCEGSEGGMSIRISNVTDTETYKEIQVPDTRYEFADKDLKGLDKTQVYCLTLKDQSGNILTAYGNIGISPELGKAPKSIKLNKTYVKLNSATRDTMQLTASVPGKDKEVVWQSSDPRIATVDQNGLVRAVLPAAQVGAPVPQSETITIEAVSRYGGGTVKAECTVEVHNFSVTAGGVAHAALTFDKDLETQPTLNLRAQWDNDGDAKFVKYSTTDTSVINIKDGIVTPVGVGRAVIKAERDGYTAYCDVTVSLPLKGAVITLDGEDVASATLTEGHGETADGIIEYRLGWVPSPAGIQNDGTYTAYFTSSRPDLVAVEAVAGGGFHLVAVKPTDDEEVVITLNVVKHHTDPTNAHADKIVATDTLRVKVLKNLDYPVKLYEDAPDIVTVYTDIAAGSKKKNLKLSDVALPEGWRWLDDQTTVLYEGTITEFDAIYELEGYTPVTRTREEGNPIRVWVGTAQAPRITAERYGRSFITKTEDIRRSGLALNVVAGNVSAQSNAVLDNHILHYTLSVTNENGLEITHDELDNTRGNPLWFYVEAGEAEAGEQLVTVTATYECEWIYEDKWEDGTYIPKRYTSWNEDTVLTTEETYRVVTGSVVDTVKIERSNMESGKTELLGRPGPQTLAADAEYTYTVTAYDQWGERMEDARFTWECKDSEVLTVSGSADTAEVVTSSGGGKTVLTCMADDDGGYTAEMTAAVVNARPHVEGTKVTVNTEVDYENYPGMGDTIAVIPAYEKSLTGTPVITKDQGEDAQVSDVFELVQQSGRHNRENYHVVVKKDAEVRKSDSGNYYIRTSTDAGYYFAPLKITVTTKKPSVTIKQTDKVNLFYKHDTGTLKVSIKGDIWTKTPEINLQDNITWGGKPEEGQPGFVLTSEQAGEVVKGKTEYDITINQQAIELDVKNKLADKNLLKGELEIKIPGYKTPVKKNISISTIYKAPVYTIYGTNNLSEWDLTKYTVKGGVVMCPDIGWPKGRTIVRVSAADQTQIRDQLQSAAGLAWKSKSNRINEPRNTQLERVICYDYITWNNKAVDAQIFNNGDGIDYLQITTTSKKGLSDTLEFHSSEWRGTVKAKLSLKMIKPALVLDKPTITVNKNYTAETYRYGNAEYSTRLSFKNFIVDGIGTTDISIKGDKRSQPLLDSGVLKLTYNEQDGGILSVVLSDDEALRQTLKAGSYKFTLTPYITPWSTTDTALKTFKPAYLTVKVVDKEIQAKASVKGKLDLLKVYGYDHNDEIDETGVYKNEFKNLIKGSYVELNTKFSNIDIENDPIKPINNNNPAVSGVRLIGEYADQFTIECLTEHKPNMDVDHYIIRRSEASYSVYNKDEDNKETDEADTGNRKLYAKESYRLQAVYTLESGIEVTSNVFVIKPIQSVPKIKMNIKSAELYASSTGEENGITVFVTIPEGYGYNFQNSFQNGRGAEDLFDASNLNIRPGSKEEEKNYIFVRDGNEDAVYDRKTGETTLEYRFNVADGRGSFVKTNNKGIKSRFTFTYELRGRDRKSKDASTNINLTLKR